MTVRFFRRGAPALLLAPIAALALSSCSSTLNDAATVTYPQGDSSATMHVESQDFKKELSELVKNKAIRDSFTQSGATANEDQLASRIAASWLGLRIGQTAVDREFEAAGLEISDADVKKAEDELANPSQDSVLPISPTIFDGATFKQFSPDFRRTLAERRARATAVLDHYKTPTDAMKKAFYEANKAAISCRRVAHVLTTTEAEAKDTLKQLEAGEPMADVAKEHSIDEGSKVKGGDLGCLQPGQFVEAFQKAADGADLDTPVGPIKTEFGYHVLEVTERAPSYAEVEEQIAPVLQGGGAVNSLMSLAKVRVDPRFGTPGGVTQQQDGTVTFVVKPPSAPNPATERDPGATTTTNPNLAG